MISITDKNKCCGCQSCVNICPHNSICMKEDEEGFLYPQVDKKKCVNCGLCERVCPILHKPNTYAVLEAYACKHNSKDIKLKSSSGGVFSAMAENILKEGGIVFGAGFDKNWNVVHTYTESIENLDQLRRSKYVQSYIGDTFKQAKTFLDQRRKVLFTGTPCQIAGLRKYLGKEYDNLLTAEIICHAVPSPAVWQKFLRENIDFSQLKAINFREKRIGWKNSYVSFLFPNELNAHGNRKHFSEKILYNSRMASSIHRNTFLRGFLSELFNRPACHKCLFKGLNERLADFTLGDLWGPWPNIITKEDQKLGMSAVLINTTKGQHYFEIVQSAIMCCPIEKQRVAQFNSCLISSIHPHPRRAEFFSYYKKENFNKLVKKILHIKPVYIELLYIVIKNIIRKAVRADKLRKLKKKFF